LQAYYTVFDRDNNRLGFVKNQAIINPSPVKSYKAIIIDVSVVGGLLFIAVVIYLIVRACRKKPPNVNFYTGEERVIVRYKKEEQPIIENNEEEVD
jgi:hypothetical protein